MHLPAQQKNVGKEFEAITEEANHCMLAPPWKLLLLYFVNKYM